MKQKILGLRTIIYKVADLGAAKKWYAQAFQSEPYFDQPYYVGFAISGYELGLQPEDQTIIEKHESVLAYWGVEEIDSQYNFFLSLGAIPHEMPTNVGGEIVVASVKDLWGNVIGLIYNPQFTLL